MTSENHHLCYVREQYRVVMPSSSQLWLPGTVLVIGACSAHYHCHHHHNYHNDHKYHKYQNYLNYHNNHIFCAKKVVIRKVLGFCASAAFIITIKDLQILAVICTNKKSLYPLPWPWGCLRKLCRVLFKMSSWAPFLFYGNFPWQKSCRIQDIFSKDQEAQSIRQTQNNINSAQNTLQSSVLAYQHHYCALKVITTQVVITWTIHHTHF